MLDSNFSAIETVLSKAIKERNGSSILPYLMTQWASWPLGLTLKVHTVFSDTIQLMESDQNKKEVEKIRDQKCQESLDLYDISPDFHERIRNVLRSKEKMKKKVATLWGVLLSYQWDSQNITNLTSCYRHLVSLVQNSSLLKTISREFIDTLLKVTEEGRRGQNLPTILQDIEFFPNKLKIALLEAILNRRAVLSPRSELYFEEALIQKLLKDIRLDAPEQDRIAKILFSVKQQGGRQSLIFSYYSEDCKSELFEALGGAILDRKYYKEKDLHQAFAPDWIVNAAIKTQCGEAMQFVLDRGWEPPKMEEPSQSKILGALIKRFEQFPKVVERLQKQLPSPKAQKNAEPAVLPAKQPILQKASYKQNESLNRISKNEADESSSIKTKLTGIVSKYGLLGLFSHKFTPGGQESSHQKQQDRLCYAHSA